MSVIGLILVIIGLLWLVLSLIWYFGALFGNLPLRRPMASILIGLILVLIGLALRAF